MVVLDEWSSYRGGLLNIFDCILFINAVSTFPAAGNDKSKTSMPGSCNAHVRNLFTAK